jgi:hypothetical protein
MLGAYAAAKAAPGICSGLLRAAACSSGSGAAPTPWRTAAAPHQQQTWRGYAGAGARPHRPTGSASGCRPRRTPHSLPLAPKCVRLHPCLAGLKLTSSAPRPPRGPGPADSLVVEVDNDAEFQKEVKQLAGGAPRRAGPGSC